LRKLLERLNFLPVFDTNRWPARELLSRICGIAAVSFFLVRKAAQYPQQAKYSTFFQPLAARLAGGEAEVGEFGLGDLWILVWAVESAIFLGYILSFLTRERSKKPPVGFMEVVFPFIVAGLPVFISMLPYTFTEVFPRTFEILGTRFSRTDLLWVAEGLMVAGGLLDLVGLLALRRAFTIMTDARTLVTRGPFALVRHPLYTGHFVMFLGATLLHLSASTAAVYAAFVAGQYVRARIEERKLESVFPEYAAYRERTGMFFPRPAFLRGKKRRNEE